MQKINSPDCQRECELGEEQRGKEFESAGCGVTSVVPLDGDGSAVQTGTGSSEGTGLTLSGGRIMLPVRRPVASGDKTVTDIIAATIPDVGAELVKAMNAQQEKTTRLWRFVYGLGLVAVLFAVAFLWPNPPSPWDTTYDVAIPTLIESGPRDREYQDIWAQCESLRKDRKWSACAERLREPVEDILKSRRKFSENAVVPIRLTVSRDDKAKFARNACLVSLFFQCRQKKEFTDRRDMRTEMRPLWEQAVALDGDSPEWSLYGLYFESFPYADIYMDYRELLSVPPRPEGNLTGSALRKEKARWLRKDFKKLEQHAGRLRERIEEHRDNKEFYEKAMLQLDKMMCRVLVGHWIVKGYPSYPDDARDKGGVQYREAAYEIAKRHENDIFFLKVRREIVEKLIADGWHYNNCYFDGKTVRQGDLKNEKKAIDEKIARWEKQNRKEEK